MRPLKISLIIALVLVTCTHARTIHIDANGTGDYPTIQAAIDDANNGDEIVVADGIYTGSGNRGIDFLGKSITVRSENGPRTTKIDCEGVSRAFYFTSNEDHNSVLQGLTIINGPADPIYGGGIFCEASSPTIKNCIIESCQGVSRGGAIYIQYSSVQVIDCIFEDNEASYGGVIFCTNSNALILNCEFYNNESHEGGAMFVTGPADPTIKNCLFAGNQSEKSAGAILINCGSPNIINCTFTGNHSGSNGGSLANILGFSPTLQNCIFWANTADSLGEEIYNSDGSHPVISYCDIEGGWNGPKVYTETGGSVTDGGGNINANPLFTTGARGNYYLSQITAGQTTDSPCVDSGSDTAIAIGLDTLTTRTDHLPDANTADIGFHYQPVFIPWIQALPGSFVFTANQDGPNPSEQYLSICNAGPNTLNWTIDYDCNWLTAEPNSGNSTGEVDDVNLIVDITGLGGGVHNCELIISDPCAENNPQIVPVNLRVIGPIIELSETHFDFTAEILGENPPDQILGISNTGGSTLNWQISESCSWLTAEPNSGNSTGEVDDVNLIVDITGLGGGVHNCELIISDPCAENTPQIVSVALDVQGPIIGLSASQFDFVFPPGGGNPPDQTLSIYNNGVSTLNWTIEYDCNWLTVDPNSGSSTGDINEVILSVDTTGLDPNFDYSCELTVSDPNAENNPQIVEVYLLSHEVFPICWLWTYQCYGDSAQDNGLVATQDFLLFRPSYNKSYPDPAYNPCCDANRDGHVNVQDFLIFRPNYNKDVSGNPPCALGGTWPPF